MRRGLGADTCAGSPRPRRRGRRSRERRPSRTACRSARRRAAAVLVSFSVNSSSGGAVGDRLDVEAESPERRVLGHRPRRPARLRCRGFSSQPSCVQPHDQVLRNQSVGSRCSVAASGPAVGDGDADQDVVRRRLGVLGEDVEVAVVVEHAGVGELELRVVLPRRRVLLDEPRVGKLAPADTCRAPSCTSASASSRGSSSTPSRPRRGCLRARSGRTAAP